MTNLIKYLIHIFNLFNTEPGAFFYDNKDNKKNVSLFYSLTKITVLSLLIIKTLSLPTVRTYKERDY